MRAWGRGEEQRCLSEIRQHCAGRGLGRTEGQCGVARGQVEAERVPGHGRGVARPADIMIHGGEEMLGHRVLIDADLFDTETGGLKAPVQEGSRSVAFLFERLGEGAEPMGFGAVVERLREGGSPGGRLTAEVAFWSELAAVYATPGTAFDLWLGRTVGRGVVTDVVQFTSAWS